MFQVVATPLIKVSSCSNVTFTFTSESDWEIAVSIFNPLPQFLRLTKTAPLIVILLCLVPDNFTGPMTRCLNSVCVSLDLTNKMIWI